MYKAEQQLNFLVDYYNNVVACTDDEEFKAMNLELEYSKGHNLKSLKMRLITLTL